MIYSVEKSARTVEEAKLLAISELNTTADGVNVEVLEQGNRGLFGLIGNKMAKVRVTLKNSMGFFAMDFFNKILKHMKVDVKVEVSEMEDNISLKVIGDDIAVIIGKRGGTLDALQYIVNLAVNKNSDVYKRVFIDVEDYKVKREERLEKMANDFAHKAIKTRRNVVLEPMNSYERRVIHSALQNNDMIKTYSVGNEPYRRIVIQVKKQGNK